jgi:hypothetical protein
MATNGETQQQLSIKEALQRFNPYAHTVGVLGGIVAAMIGSAVYIKGLLDDSKNEIKLVEARAQKEIAVVKANAEKEIEVTKKEIAVVKANAEKEIEVTKKEIEVVEANAKKDVEAAKQEVANKFLMYGYAEEYKRFQEIAGVKKGKTSEE